MESSAGIAERGRAPRGVAGVDHPVGRRPRPQRAGSGRAGARSGFLSQARDYVALTKPRIISLLLWTTVTTMFVAEPSGLAFTTIVWTCLGGYLAAGGAGAINHYIDRDIDARMGRTKGRPIVSGRIEPVRALVFGIALGALAVAQLWVTTNALTALLALLGLLGYTLLYSAFLKRRTPQNIVIGGVAGAIPPLVGWAAASGSLTLDALFPFMIVFLWTPPHFWALALLIRDDYEKTGIPMMPVVRGEEHTRSRILLYSVVLVAFTLLPVLTGFFGGVYLAAAVVLGAGFVIGAWHLLRDHSRRAALQLHLGSLAYLFLLFGAMAADRIISA